MTTEDNMDYEKKYNEALKRANAAINIAADKDLVKGVAITIFPELAESEDEIHRKWILEYLYDGFRKADEQFKDQFKSAIDWFEKQKERVPENEETGTRKEEKPAEWGKNDTVFLNEITDFFENKTVRLQHDIDMYAHWLKSLPERFNLPPKQEWSEDIIRKAVKEVGLTQHQIDWFKTNVFPPKQEWSEEDGMETINVFRPLAGTSIESATKQAVNKFTNSGKKFLLAFNGVFILIDNTKSVQDIVSEYNRSLGGKKKEQGQSEGEPNDFEITLNDCMLAAQQYPPGKIGWDVVKMWAEELSNYCPQSNQKWSEFDRHSLERAIWYVENPAPSVVKDTNLVLWLKSLKNRGNFLKSNINSPSWKPNKEQMEALKITIDYMPDVTLDRKYDTLKPRCMLMTLLSDLNKLMEE